MLDSNLTLHDQKARLRTEVLALRDALPDREQRAQAIHARTLAHPAWVGARMISTFVGVKSEVPTIPLIEAALATGKKVAVPVVEGNTLAAYRIESVDDLAPAPFGLLEPRRELRRKNRRLVATVVHLWLVPGVAFDRTGARLGYGKGYYDGLLSRVKPFVPTLALAFDVQVVAAVPVGPADVPVSSIVTDLAEYVCRDLPIRRPSK